MSRIAIINTNGIAWGGCDPIWEEATIKAISDGHKILISLNKIGERHNRIRNLEEKGTYVFYRKNYHDSILFKILIKVLKAIFTKDIGLPMFRHVKEFEPDVIFINLAGGSEFVSDKSLFNLIIKSSVPIYMMVHGYDERYIPDINYLEVLKIGYSKAVKVFFTSQYQMEGTSQKIMYSKGNFKVIVNPINFEPAIIEYPTSETINFGLPGSLTALTKGQDIIINLLAEPIWRERNWRLNIYGSGSDEAYLKILVEYNNLGKNVIFHGFANDIRNVWKQNHIALLPSRQDTGPLTAVEAMACGRAIIGTHVGLMAHLIDQETGFLSEAANFHLLKRTLEQAWKHRNNWRSMGINAYKAYQEKYQSLNNKKLIDYLLD